VGRAHPGRLTGIARGFDERTDRAMRAGPWSGMTSFGGPLDFAGYHAANAGVVPWSCHDGTAVNRWASPQALRGSSQDPDTIHGGCSHDDIALVNGRSPSFVDPLDVGWASARTRRGPSGRRLLTLLLLLPMALGMVGAPAATPAVRGDDLSDAKAAQAHLKHQIEEQKAAVAALDALQASLSADIASTQRQLSGINANLVTVRAKITTMSSRIEVVQRSYDDLVLQLGRQDFALALLETQETAKGDQLRSRKAMLVDRIRSAYDTGRTSMLEAFLSGGNFNDLLTEMNDYIDVGEQDKALAAQIVVDQTALAQLHQDVSDTRARTDDLRVTTASQKAKLDKSLTALKASKLELRRLEKATQQNLKQQRLSYARLQANKKNAAHALAVAAAAQKRLAHKIAAIVARQAQQGHIPSQYNGTLDWPMSGTVSQEFGCTGFPMEPPYGNCAHFHQGIDIVAPYGTKVRASGDGVVAYIGWNYADGADPAWIVIIAHSSGLETWYAHMQARYPGGIRQGSHVTQGQVIGYEGNTGHTTGAHLHWAVMLDGNFVNPRLFL
jgi:murein DD-endopeptidase MepM/ murein hydrolase activator NlpD